jgi:hypothetical protein
LKILTDFTAEVRRLTQEWLERRGHAIRLSARVPSHPETALAVGMDAAAWARNGLIDKLIVTPFLLTETDMPVELWRELLEGTRVELGVCIMSSLGPHHAGLRAGNNLPAARGAAAGLLDRGADFLELFNYFTELPNPSQNPSLRRLLEQIGSAATCAPRARRHVVTFTDFNWHGWPMPGALPCGPLPAKFRIPIGPAPAAKQIAQVRLGVQSAAAAPDDKWIAEVNGQVCRFAGKVAPPPHAPMPDWAFDIPSGALHRGANYVEIDGRTTKNARLEWVEIAISESDGAWPTDPVETSPFEVI